MKRILIAMLLCILMIGIIAAPALAVSPKTVAISWVEVAYRYSYDGTQQAYFPPTRIGPLDFVQTGQAYHAVSIAQFYSIPVSDIKGSLVISGSGNLSAEITYIRGNSPLPLRDLVTGKVTVDPNTGTMIGTYTQYRQAYGSREEVLAVYPYAIPDKSPNGRGWWFLDYTEYVTAQD
jgi:hypothetical protein